MSHTVFMAVNKVEFELNLFAHKYVFLMALGLTLLGLLKELRSHRIFYFVFSSSEYMILRKTYWKPGALPKGYKICQSFTTV